MSVLVYSTRSLTGRFVTSLLQQMKIVETVSKDIDLLMMTKTFGTISEIESISQLSLRPVNYFYKFYNDEVIHMKNWEEAYEKLDVSCLKDYTAMFLYGGILSAASGLLRDKSRDGKFPVND